MVSKTVVIKNEQGLHMRPAGVLAKEAAKYKSNISLVFNGKKINAKSVMNIIAGCMKCGSQIEVECDGADEQPVHVPAALCLELKGGSYV